MHMQWGTLVVPLASVGHELLPAEDDHDSAGCTSLCTSDVSSELSHGADAFADAALELVDVQPAVQPARPTSAAPSTQPIRLPAFRYSGAAEQSCQLRSAALERTERRKRTLGWIVWSSAAGVYVASVIRGRSSTWFAIRLVCNSHAHRPRRRCLYTIVHTTVHAHATCTCARTRLYKIVCTAR